ncbi:hypothetical protein BKA65DRAFT_493977, partial [Rhexocercosporidium sp. MPI-PUGE-AT-0058]
MEQGQAVPEGVVDKKSDSGEENPYLAKKHLGWCGRFEADEWYCKCSRKAMPLLTTRNTRNKGRWFYMCPVREPKQEGDPEPCRFFVWFDEEDAAKKWMEFNPTTPTKQSLKAPNNGSSKKMREWLFPSGKKRAIEDISDEDVLENEEDKEGKGKGKYIERDEDFVIVDNTDDGDVFYRDNTRNGSPSRKSAKVTRFATPGLPSHKQLDDFRGALPTPATSGRDVEGIHEARHLQAREASPTQVQLDAAIVLGGAELEQSQGKTDLLKIILELVKADYPKLKGSTEIMIQHEIEQEARRTQAEVKGYRKTISRLRDKVDGLETTIKLLVGDDVIVLS